MAHRGWPPSADDHGLGLAAGRVEDVRGAEGLEQVGVVWGAGGDDGRESGKAGELYGWKSLFKIRLVSFVRA